MNNKRIEIGDNVKVFLGTPSDNWEVYVLGVVEYAPQGSGDCWIILDYNTGSPVYIQSFSHMFLCAKKVLPTDSKEES